MKALLSLIAIVAVVPAALADLGPGDPAPPLSVKTWIKGEPVSSLAKDKTYVVEFWATWCGPCIESIPHLTETAHKNADVTFIGVSVWEDDDHGSIKRFVDKEGDKMDYHVGYSGNQDGMAVTWMKAAAQNGIPTAFIVKDGSIQWVGHPMTIEEPLKEIKAGTFDVAKFRKAFDKKAVATRKQMALYKDLTDADALFKDGKRRQAKDRLTRILAKFPESKDDVARMRFRWLAAEDPAAWEAEAKKMCRTGRPADFNMVRDLAAIEGTAPDGNHKIARTAIEIVLGSTAKPDLTTMEYALDVYEGISDYPKAIEYLDKVFAATPDAPANAELRKSLTEKRAMLEARLKQR